VNDVVMTNDITGESPPETPPPPIRPPLIRPLEGRKVAGVAAALARTTNLPVGLIRVAFVLFVFAGGFGLLAYIAGWLLVPGEGEAHTPAQRLLAGIGGGWTWVGMGLMVIGIIVVADRIPFLSGDMVLAAALLTIGVLIYRGDLRPRPGPVPPGGEVAATESPQPHPTPEQAVLPPQPTVQPPEVYVVAPPSVPTPATPKPRSVLGRVTLALVLITLGVLAAVDQASTRIDAAPRHYLAAAVLVIGLGLLWGTWLGRARWLAVIGLFLLPPLMASPLAEFGNSFADHRPVRFSDVVADYSRPFGPLRIDLTDLPWNGEQIDLSANVAAGVIELRLPEGVAMRGRSRAGVGEVVIYGVDPGQWLVERDSGLDVEQEIFVEGSRGTVEVDLEVGAGRVVINIHRELRG
jgi:phage shock protein PspC (stress-responsive transcriptional regulator)